MLARSACLLALLLLAACNGTNPSNPVNGANPSNPDQVPSCLPPGYRPLPAGYVPPQPDPTADRGEELDVILGVVEGQVITKRRLLREVGGLAPGQDPETLERQIQAALLVRARLLVFVKEAQRNEVVVRDAFLDNFVEEQLDRVTKEASKTLGTPVSIEDYLRDKGLTMEEYREQQREILQYQAYVYKLARGLGGPTRPSVDMEVTPAEVRRIYWSHPGAFDEKPGVRFALFPIDVERYLVDDVGYLEAEEKAQADAEQMVALLQKGTSPADVAARFDIAEGMWRATPEGKFAEEGEELLRFLGEEPNAWLFDATRRPGDATSFPDPNGPLVITVLERKEGSRVPYEKAYELIVRMIQAVREQRLVEQRLIEILSTRNVVQPPALAQALLRQARHKVAEIDRDPITAAARFR